MKGRVRNKQALGHSLLSGKNKRRHVDCFLLLYIVYTSFLIVTSVYHVLSSPTAYTLLWSISTHKVPCALAAGAGCPAGRRARGSAGETIVRRFYENGRRLMLTVSRERYTEPSLCGLVN